MGKWMGWTIDKQDWLWQWLKTGWWILEGSFYYPLHVFEIFYSKTLKKIFLTYHYTLLIFSQFFICLLILVLFPLKKRKSQNFSKQRSVYLHVLLWIHCRLVPRRAHSSDPGHTWPPRCCVRWALRLRLTCSRQHLTDLDFCHLFPEDHSSSGFPSTMGLSPRFLFSFLSTS